MNRKALLFGLVAGAMLLPAQDYGVDPGPGRGVARLSVLNGEVSVRRGDSGDIVAAALNAPLMVQDRLLTGPASRAEVQFDSSNLLRAGADSEVRLSRLDDHNYQIQISIGTVTFNILHNADAQIELDTPSVSVRALQSGAYRVTVHDDGSSEITVRAGQAEIYTPRGSERLEAGQTLEARGPSSDPEYQVTAAVAVDGWDEWNLERDRYLESARSSQYVSRDVYGVEDLDRYGRWTNDATYGQVWAPSVAPGWAPYRDGRWVWEDFYGWTWVSYDPWGWAPYHYGRWFYGNAGWCWYPGPVYARHYWSPALVGFFGWGGRGGGFGFGFGNVGWVPLAPYETFHPWWGRGFYGGGYGGGRNYINNTTIVNNTNIGNVYRNARVFNGVTGVNAGDFGRNTGRFNAINGNSIGQAGLVRGALPVNPDRSSFRMADRSVRAGSLPQTRNDRFFTRGQAGSAGSFSRRTAAGQAHEWRSFGEPIHGPGSSGFSQAPRGSSQGGGQSGQDWQRFGGPRANVPAPSAGRSMYNDPGQRGGGGGFGGSQQAVRISPPIVRERSTPSYNSAPSGGGFGGGSYRSAPPSYGGGGGSYRPAPSYNNGGGGGRVYDSGGNRGSYRQAPSSGGGGGVYDSGGNRGSYRQAPSSGGGGFGGRSGGGGRSYQSAPPSGGGGGGRSSGGGSPRGGGGGGGHSGHSR